ncbi:MAG: tail fiber domain-containing protein [Lentimicrobiaceae bacterium]|nr:tail fiber domain-containing protein [Lentimicrobiaceae bacterium]
MKKLLLFFALFATATTAMSQIKVTTAGNVGVGTNAPLHKFQIGSIWTFHDGSTNKIIGRNSFWNGTNHVRIQQGYASQIVFDPNGKIEFQMVGDGAPNSIIPSWNTVTMANNGNLGIGITSPAQKLHVVGNTTITGNLGVGVTSPTQKLHVFGTSFLQGNVNIGGAIQINPYTNTDYAVYLDWTGDYGHAAIYSGSFRLQLGKTNNRVYKIFAYNTSSIDYGVSSDERIKENITLLENPIEKIKQISGYRYNLKRGIFPEDISEEEVAGFTKNRIGFLAQEVEKVFPELVTHPQSEEEFCSMNYDGMIPVLLEAIKEQQTQIEHLRTLIYEREYDMLFLMDQIDACCQNKPDYSSPRGQEEKDIENENIEKNLSNIENNSQSVEKARLFQNIPNPFSIDTKIEFEIPENAHSAKLLIHDMQGAEIKSYNMTQKGLCAIVVNGFELTAGMYLYTLLIDNKIIDTKRMILTK